MDDTRGRAVFRSVLRRRSVHHRRWRALLFYQHAPGERQIERGHRYLDDEKVGENWSVPEPLTAVNSETNEWFPTVSKNGNLYFGSEWPGGKGRCDLYCSRLVDGKYGTPENLGDLINSAASEVEPFIAPDESYLIFAALGLPDSNGIYDLYISFRRDGAW